MDFLQKLDFMMEKYSLNKRTLSKNSGIPYTTIDGWYKKGYEGMQLKTLRALSDYFNTVVDYWATNEVTDPNAWKTNGFVVSSDEMGHIQKYRLLDPYGKEAVDSVLEAEYKRYRDLQEQFARQQTEASEEIGAESVLYVVPRYSSPMSAGTGEIAGDDGPENEYLIKEPPRGTSYIAPVSGDSMEPTYHDGDLLFIRATPEVRSGRIGVFLMDGKQWVKELGKGELISHNPEYDPIPMAENIQCQGLVLGVCDKSYFSQD